MSVSLQRFYEAVKGFLIESKLETEQSLLGYSENEIMLAEQHWNLKFPEAYKLFLQYFGLAIDCFKDQDWSIESIKFADELSQEVASRNKINFDNWFPFSERQWYSFYSFKIDCAEVENPEVMLVVEGDDGMENYYYPSFTKWLMKELENHLNLLVSLKKLKSEEQLEKFLAFKLIP